MKKVIAIFLTIVPILTFLSIFIDFKSTQQNEMELAERSLKYSYQIIIPSSISNLDQEDVYIKIKNALDKYKGNIFYTRVSGKNDKIIKYIYISSDEYYSKFKLTNGNFFSNDEMESDKYISSIKTTDSDQIGTIATFAGVNFLEIRTLKNMVQTGYSLDGYVTVSFNNLHTLNLFISELEKSFNEKGFKEVPYQNIYTKGLSISNLVIILSLSVYLIVMLLVLYSLLNSTKVIGIEKLLGFSNIQIYTKRILLLLLTQIILFLSITIIMIKIMIKSYNIYFWIFLNKIVHIYLIETAILLLISSIPFLYTNKIKISDMIKNKKPITAIMIINYFMKTVLSIIFLLSLNHMIVNFNTIYNVLTNSYEQWEEVKNYAVIPNWSNISMELFTSQKFAEDQRKIYLEFNSKGSILADFSQYNPQIRKVRLSETKYAYERDHITINPNYLKLYPIYNSENEKISISESETSYIYLVPDKYKAQEKEIRLVLERWKDPGSPGFTKQPILIWSKSNQKLFSMSIEVNPNIGNYVIDPIVRVMTEANGPLIEYNLIGMNSNPFKIKVDDYLNPANSIKPTLIKYGYDQYIKVISSANEQIASQIKYIKQMLIYMGLIISLLCFCIFILIVQNIYNFFDKNKHHIAIKQFHGYSMFANYELYYLTLILNWLIVYIILSTTRLIALTNLLTISFFVFFLELFITTISIYFINKRKVIKVIKGAE